MTYHWYEDNVYLYKKTHKQTECFFENDSETYSSFWVTMKRKSAYSMCNKISQQQWLTIFAKSNGEFKHDKLIFQRRFLNEMFTAGF